MRKRRTINRLLNLLLLLALFLCLLSSASADAPLGKGPPWLTEGFRPMCRQIPAECAPYDDDRRTVQITPRRWALLDDLNRAVNREVTYQTDQDHYGVPEHFAYPTDGYGDCEDYALEKRRRLVAIGWPRRALLLMIGRERVEPKLPELHMVLVVRTDKGDFVLNNQTNAIEPVEALQIDIYWIQSQTDPRQFDEAKDLQK